MGHLMMDLKGWPYDSFDCLSFYLNMAFLRESEAQQGYMLIRPALNHLFILIFAGPKRGQPTATPGFSIFIRSFIRPLVLTLVSEIKFWSLHIH